MSAITTINPANEQVLKTYPLLTQQEVASLIDNMDKSQKIWADESLDVRIKAMQRVALLLRQNLATYANLMTTEMGKPITQALAEIEKCAKLCDYYTFVAKEFFQPELIQTGYKKSYRTLEPIGIVFAIMPWNYPFWQVMRFAVPNILLGNAGLLKHSPNTTGSGLAIQELFLQAGFPQDLFQSVVIDVALAPFIINHPKVSGVTLTGSYQAGQAVASEAGKVVKKVVLELGGSDPYLILHDADLSLAAEQCVMSRLNNCGQVCIAAKRMIVVKAVKDKFIELVMQKAKQYKIGDPLDPKTNLGPMARSDLRDKLALQVEKVIQEGATCLLGGKPEKTQGYYFPATVLTDIKPDSSVFTEELFGPVICIIEAKDEAEAIFLANNTDYGLAAGVFTQDRERGEQIAVKKLKAGTTAVNSLVSSDPRLPFGGTKKSGYGRELSREGLHEFANIKTIIVQ
ncbi:MAG: succinate-semialdehyde dehydrogenase [Legionellales bacterium RIFCSPHIGHO2_12_FULL_37_14]|nr:MAG: succinate-semialdehyde dehydrogenase [Legionellales bacterium RIFCSPHIGHO2_12_FULL_37_14]